MSSINDFYRDRYADVTPGAGPETETTFQRRVRAALAACDPAPRRVLDFGCNVGIAAALFSDAGHEVVGVDISASAIRLARERVPGATFVQVQSETGMPFDDGRFDVCFCSEVIEHLFDVRGFVREVHRVLRADGLFLITTPYHGWLKNLLVVMLNFDRHFNPTGGHIRFFSRRSLTGCLEADGFTVEDFRGIGRCWPLWRSMFVAARKRG